VIEKASFALVAFIDETIINSNWSQKEIWQSFPLQLELFNRYDAGDEYYVYLDSFRKHPQNHADLLEIYYQCMALGFKGKYQFQKREQLRDLIGDIYLDLRRSTDPSDIVLSPHGQRKDEIADAVKKGKLPIWPICIALATVGLLFYIIMLVWISGNAGSVADAIGQIR